MLEGHNSEYMAVWHCWRGIFQSPLWCVSTSHGQSLTPPLSNRSPYIVVIVKRMLSAMKLKARFTYIAVPLFSEAKSAFTFSCVTIYDPSVHFVPLSIIHLNPIQPLPSTRQPWITKTISLKKTINDKCNKWLNSEKHKHFVMHDILVDLKIEWIR